MQKKLVKILIIFTGTVILLTIISRIGASFAVPTVSVSKPKRMKIAHRVERRPLKNILFFDIKLLMYAKIHPF